MASTELGIPEAINLAGKHLQQLNGYRPISRAAIIKEVTKYGNWPEHSIIPSDYCYNHTNKGARPARDRIFLKVGRDQYNYVGRHYRYSGQVASDPRRS